MDFITPGPSDGYPAQFDAPPPPISPLGGVRIARVRLLLLAIPVLMVTGILGLARSSSLGAWRSHLGPISALAGVDPCSQVQGQSIELRLRPGGCGPVPSPPGMVASNIPPGDIVLRLPRYPGAEPVRRTMPPVFSMPLDPYLKEASGMFLVPTDDSGAVQQWYTDRVDRLGYLSQGVSPMPYLSTITSTTSIQTFSWPNAKEREIQIAVETAGSAGSLLLIEAHVVTPPLRPAASMIPADLASLTIDYNQASAVARRQWEQESDAPAGTVRPWHRTLRDASTLARVAALLNALPVLTGIYGGIPDPLVTILTFRTKERQSLVFTKAYCCAGLRAPGGVSLDDSMDGTFWVTIADLAPRH